MFVASGILVVSGESGAAVGGEVYAIGGQLGGAEVHRYDPATRLADLPTLRGHTTSTVLDGRVLVIGGTLKGNIPAEDVSAYDPLTGKWAAATPLPAGRKTPVADVTGSRIVSATGNGGGPTTTMWIGSRPGAQPVPSDTTEPVVGRPRPAAGSVTRNRAPTVRATVRDAGSELARADMRLYVGGRAKAFSYDAKTDKLGRATGRLAYGRHFVRVTATDDAGNRAVRSWSFRVVKDR